MRSFRSRLRHAAPAPCDDIQASVSELFDELDWFGGQGLVAAVVGNLPTGGIDQVRAQGEGDRLAVGLRGERPVGATELAPGAPLAVGLAPGAGAAGEEAGVRITEVGERPEDAVCAVFESGDGARAGSRFLKHKTLEGSDTQTRYATQ